MATTRRILLTVCALLLLIADVLSAPSFGILLLPGTLLLAASAALARDAGRPQR